jgi:transposase-like protein
VVVRFSEEDKKTIWDMREAGVPVKRIAKHLGRQNSSLRKFIADAGDVRRLGNGLSFGCRSKSERRSRVDWPRVVRSG